MIEKKLEKHLLILILSIFVSLSTFASGQKDELDYIKKAEDELYTNPRLSSMYSLKIINSNKDDHPEKKAKALYLYAQAERFLGDYDGSIKALYESLDIISKQDSKQLASIYNLMSILYCNLSDYTKAIDFNDKAMILFKVENDSTGLAQCYNNKGIIHTYLNEFDVAEQFLNKALVINRSQKDLKGIAANLNNLCLYPGDIDKKLSFIHESIVINKNLRATWALGENYNNMGKQYLYAGQYSKAIEALSKANEIATEIGAKGLICDNCEYYSLVYSAMGNYQQAYQKLTELNVINKEIQSENKLRSIEQEILQAKYQQQQQIIEKKQHNYKIELLKRNIIIIIFAFVSLILVCIWLYHKDKRKKNMALMMARYDLEQSKHELTEQKVRIQEMELKNIQTALESSRQEAINFAVFLQSRNELLDKISEMIKQGYKLNEAEMTLHLKKINAFIKQYQLGDKTTNALLLSIEDKNQKFIQQLVEHHPDLTQGEKHLATLLRVNLSTKEIAMLTGTIPKTINMNRYRLRKSLNLTADEDLIEYLQNI